MKLASQRELTIRVVLLGAFLSIVMGAANVYLGLRAGMTVSASIPAAVISMVILRRVLKGGTILENNQVQTAASAGESLAAGIIFTIPALVMIGVWGDFNYWLTTAIAIAGGLLGVLFMIPMRKVFIVNREMALPFPEGVACAEVLKAGDHGESAAQGARAILTGGLLGAAVKFGESFLHLLKGGLETAFIGGGRVFYFGIEALPALIGVGYIIGLSVASNIFIGGALSWILILPLMGDVPANISPVDAAYEIWSTRIRFMGVGAMVVGGLSTIWHVRYGLVEAVKAVGRRASMDQPLAENEHSLSMRVVIFWMVIAVAITGLIYAWLIGNPWLALLTTVIMVVAAFFFTAVASYIVGIVGNSNSPMSGMTITAMLFAGLLIMIFGFEGTDGMLATLGVAAIVCCVAGTAGDVCNDLKTGAIVGATPYKQQIMQIVGVLTGALVMAPVLQLLQNTVPGGIGGPQLPAPQAALFASLARGFFGNEPLPWDMVSIGVGIGLVIAIIDSQLQRRKSAFRLHIMPTAVGMYLPLGLSTAIVFGGLISWWTRRRAVDAPAAQRRGMLFASGLIAGESLLGVGLAGVAATGLTGLPQFLPDSLLTGLTLLALAGVAGWLYRASVREPRT